MTEHTELVPQDEVRLGALAMRPESVVSNATKVANALADVVKERKLFTNIQGKNYVRVEGWNTLGAMLGVLPRERDVAEIDNGYEAYVELVRTSDGAIIGGASAICTRDERNWKNRDDYAVRSMAVTRATGKAFRLGFSWIMKLAGYEATPAEEMDFVEAEYQEVTETPEKPAQPPTTANGSRPYAPEQLKERITEFANKYENKKWTANDKQRGLAMGMLNECFASDDADEQRHSTLAYLFGVDSGNDLTDSQVLALLDWLKPEKDSGGAYVPAVNAQAEGQGTLSGLGITGASMTWKWEERTGYRIHLDDRTGITTDRSKAVAAWEKGCKVEVGPVRVRDSYKYGLTTRKWNYPQAWRTFQKGESDE